METPVTENQTPETLDLTAWLSGATVAEASVDIYQRPDLLGRIEEWQRRYERAINEPATERSAGERDPIKALEAEGEKLLDELEASKSVWYLRALSSEDEKAINEAHPLPESPPAFTEKPPFLNPRPTEAQAKAFLGAHEAWQERHKQHTEEHKAEHEAYLHAATASLVSRGSEKIARTLARIEVDGKVIAESITAEQAESLPAKIGEVQVGKILAAISKATEVEPQLPAPFSQKDSGDNQS
ncbi:MAG TPA: hypothetical protein VEP72_01880 [Microbacterium sp.]|nr:hypothetical protein [Microbacterium sp.]